MAETGGKRPVEARERGETEDDGDGDEHTEDWRRL